MLKFYKMFIWRKSPSMFDYIGLYNHFAFLFKKIKIGYQGNQRIFNFGKINLWVESSLLFKKAQLINIDTLYVWKIRRST